MHVYVLMTSYAYEGSEMNGIFATQEAAEAFGRNVECDVFPLLVARDGEDVPHSPRKNYMYVERMEVQE